MIVAKALVATSASSRRAVLKGQTITFPQHAKLDCDKERTWQSYGDAALEAALGDVQLFLVGPRGKEGHLERKALAVVDKRSQPDVAYNLLQMAR